MLKTILMMALALGVPSLAYAAPDVSGSGNVVEPNGFPGVCDQPCFTVTKSYEVYFAGNPTAPAGTTCTAAENTYVYQVSHTGGAGPFVPGLTLFEIAVETDDVGSAGFLPGFGINPSGTAVEPADFVKWDFLSPVISNGATSTKLFICSRLTPGDVTDSIVSVDGQFSIDAPSTCVAPLFQPPSDGEPLPCTIGFWKNRSDGKKGTLKWFPDSEFDQVVTQAVAISGGLFADEAALLDDLGSKGNRPADQRARQQFAAFLLNLAAGDLYPENSKCKLFDGNQIDVNACGSGINISTAVTSFFTSYNAGNFIAAKDCADETNNGIGVVGANSGE